MCDTATYLLTPNERGPTSLGLPRALQYTIKLKANPGNPANDVVFNPKYQNLYAKNIKLQTLLE